MVVSLVLRKTADGVEIVCEPSDDPPGKFGLIVANPTDDVIGASGVPV